MDQVPFNIALLSKYCYAPIGAECVQNPQPTASDKRFGTLQVLIGYDVQNDVVLRGTGTVLAAEEPSYHPLVKVRFQKKHGLTSATPSST